MAHMEMEVGSYDEPKGALFDSESYLDIEDNPELSLQLLANCVYICSCTILHERKLIPERSFRTFKVYDDVNGYLVDESDRNGLFVSQKYAIASQHMFMKKLSKFAILVQTDQFSSPIEAFVWHFNFDDKNEASVQLGLNGRVAAKLNIDYKNMNETCQQFCRMFKTLRKVLDDLSPLPEKVIPSFRLAYFGDAMDVNGYEKVDEFVDLQQYLVGATRLPREQITMTYGSKFQRNVEEQYEENFEVSTMLQGKSFISEIHTTDIERTRDTNISKENSIVSHDNSSDDNLLSIPDNALIDVEFETTNVELSSRDRMEVDPSTPTEELSQLATNISTECNPPSEFIQESVNTAKNIENVVFDLPRHEEIFKKLRKASRRLSVPKQVTFADDTVAPNTIQTETQKVPNFGRVHSLLSLRQEEKNEKKPNFGRVKSLKNLLDDVFIRDQKTVKKLRETTEPNSQKKRYAISASIN